MSIRDKFLLTFAPSIFPGIRIGEWLKLLHENGFRIQPRYSMRAASISACSIMNSILGWYEGQRYGEAIGRTEVPPPLFILGHWRSGTTLVQSLFALDPRFAGPTLYEVLFPHTFLTTETLLRRPLSSVLPRRRLTDNLRFGLDVAHEDEFAICTMSLCSPHISMVYPSRAEHYDRFLTLRGLPDEDISRWRGALMQFLRKVTWKYRRPLVLKSPPHTARVRFLLDMFPEAKFLHIHRDPYAVFQSTLRTTIDSSQRQRLQAPPSQEAFEDRILRMYRVMYEAFFEDRSLIPNSRFYEIRFENLEREPVNVLRGAYEALNLPSFHEIEPDVRRYTETLTEYRKNVHAPLPELLRRRILREWRQCFDEWGYST